MNDIYKDLIQDFLLHLGKERNLSQNTISAYGRDLDRFFTFLVNYDSTLANNLDRIDRHVIRHFLGSEFESCLLYTSPSPRDQRGSRMPSSA